MGIQHGPIMWEELERMDERAFAGLRGQRSGQMTALSCLPQLQIAAAGQARTHVRGQETPTTPSTSPQTPPLPPPPAHELRNLSQSSSLSGRLASSSHPVWLHCLRYQPIRLALAFSVSLRTRPLEEVPKVIDESSNSSCLCSSSESSSMYQADRRP